MDLLASVALCVFALGFGLGVYAERHRPSRKEID